MQGRDLKLLAATANLIKLDIEAAPLTLVSEDGTSLYAVYRGNYSGGWRVIGADVPEMKVAIDAARFKAYANLFDDDDLVSLSLDGTQLELRSARSQLKLATRDDLHEIDEVGRDFDGKSFDGAISISAESLLSEVAVASTYVAETNFRPVFTGIRLQASNNELTLTTHDGGAIIFRATISARTLGDFDVTVVATDLLLGLQLVADTGNVVLGKLKDSDIIVVYDTRKTTVFRCALLRDPWPDMSKTFNQPRVGASVVLQPTLIRLLTNAANALGVRELVLRPAKGNRAFWSLQGETGSYATVFTGTQPLTATVTFAVDSIAPLGALGNSVTLTIPPTQGVPLVADADHRRCWVFGFSQ